LSEDEQSGTKKTGPFAAAIAALGMLIARGADDCARIGAKGASLADDGLRGAGKIGSLADDGLRGGAKVGALADDGLRGGGKIGALAGEGLHGPRGLPGGLVEDAVSAGAKAEGHTGDLVELGIDVTTEVLSYADDGDDGDDDAPAPGIVGTNPAFSPEAILRARSSTSAPELSPADIADPLGWLRAHLFKNPAGILLHERTSTDASEGLSFVLPNGKTLTDAAIHQACFRAGQHCVVLACGDDPGGACAKEATIAWLTVTPAAHDPLVPLRVFLARLLEERAKRPALAGLVISRLDVDAVSPQIVRSRLRKDDPSPKQ